MRIKRESVWESLSETFFPSDPVVSPLRKPKIREVDFFTSAWDSVFRRINDSYERLAGEVLERKDDDDVR